MGVLKTTLMTATLVTAGALPALAETSDENAADITIVTIEGSDRIYTDGTTTCEGIHPTSNGEFYLTALDAFAEARVIKPLDEDARQRIEDYEYPEMQANREVPDSYVEADCISPGLAAYVMRAGLVPGGNN